MKGIQLTPQLRYVQLTDDKGSFGLVIRHNMDKLIETFEISSREELVHLVEMFS